MDDRRFRNPRDLEARTWGFPKRVRNLPRPGTAKWGAALAGAALGIDLVAVAGGFAAANLLLAGRLIPSLPLLVVLFFYAWVVLAAMDGRRWASRLFTFLVGLSVLAFVADYSAIMSGETLTMLLLFVTTDFGDIYMEPRWVYPAVNVMVLGFQVGAVILFFTTSARRWFRRNSYHLRTKAKSGWTGYGAEID